MSEQQTQHQTQPVSKITLKGRQQIFSNVEEIDDLNVVDVVTLAATSHAMNVRDISYLWKYYKGIQPILNRTKEIRPNINNKIVENHAQEIVAFKIGYQLSEPLQYTCRFTQDVEADNKLLVDIDQLNTMMFAEDKASLDRDLFEWLCIAGVGYRFVEADKEEDIEDGGAPFEIYTLDPRNAFVIYSSDFKHKAIAGVWVGTDEVTNDVTYSVFTKKMFYKIKNNTIVSSEPHSYKNIPIVEYKLNNARMGVFEPVLTLLDAINLIESNRLDGIEQTVQSLIKFVNCEIDDKTFVGMLELGAIQVSSPEGLNSQVEMLYPDLDQSQTQITKDDLYNAVVNICGMPSRNNGSASSSDTGAAVLLRDGWTFAESHAKSYELQFKRAERDMLRLVLEICSQAPNCNIDLRIRDIELTFNRRNYENILVKSQVLTTMLDKNQIHPELAFTACGMFTDPEAAYLKSKKHFEENKIEEPVPPTDNNPNPGSLPGQPEPEGGTNAPKSASA